MLMPAIILSNSPDICGPVPLPGVATIPAGAGSVTINLAPRTDGASDAISRSATLSLASGAGYTVSGAGSAASVTIFYNPGTNYIAALRAPAAAFTTGTLLVEASRRLRFRPAKTMGLAQRLYEHSRELTDARRLLQEALSPPPELLRLPFTATAPAPAP